MSWWLERIRGLGHQNVLLLGNKCDSDSEREREVSYYEARDFAERHRLHFFEVSAKLGTNLEMAFLHFVHRDIKWKKEPASTLHDALRGGGDGYHALMLPHSSVHAVILCP